MISQQLNDQITLIGPDDDAALLRSIGSQRHSAMISRLVYLAVNLLSEQLALVNRSGFKLVTCY